MDETPKRRKKWLVALLAALAAVVEVLTGLPTEVVEVVAEAILEPSDRPVNVHLAPDHKPSGL